MVGLLACKRLQQYTGGAWHSPLKAGRLPDGASRPPLHYLCRSRCTICCWLCVRICGLTTCALAYL